MYNDFYESDRYSIDCDIDRYKLISDKTRLLPFQFKRPKSGYVIDRWFLRKECQLPFTPMLNANDSSFTIDTGYWTKSNIIFLNGKLKASGASCSLQKLLFFTPGKSYEIKIVVSEIKITTTFTGSLNSNVTTNIISFSTVGTHTTIYNAAVGDTDFLLNLAFGTGTDHAIIDYIQIREINSFNTLIGDIDLPTDLLKLYNINSDFDIIQYCGDVFPFQIPCGKYYMIIVSENNDLYYSELITIEDFIPSQSPYTILEWKNSCDLGDVIFQDFMDCAYFNRLYIEGELSTPEYPFKEEFEEDGNHTLNVTFQKWEKKSTLTVAKCPEFLVDSLSGMRLHDTVTIQRSLRKKQIETLPAFEIQKNEFELAPIFNECATNVILKFLLKDKVIDSTCCNNSEIPVCYECNYEVNGLDNLTGDLYFGNLLGEDFNLFRITTLGSKPIAGFSTGTPLAGFQYLMSGDQTLNYPVGSFIYISGTILSGNIGFHEVSAVTYDIGTDTTGIQWVGILDDATDPMSGTIASITYENITQDGDIVCTSEELGARPYYNRNEEFWSQVPGVSNVVDTDLGSGNHSYLITGFTYPGTFVKVRVMVINTGTGISTSINYPAIYTDADLLAGITILSSTFGVPVPECGSIKFSVSNFALNCNYGLSNEFIKTYSGPEC